MSGLDFLKNYSFVGDALSIVMCVMIFIILGSTYTIKKKSLYHLIIADLGIIIASVSSIAYHMLLNSVNETTEPYIYVARNCLYITLVGTMVIFYVYIRDLVKITGLLRKIADFAIIFVMIGFAAFYLISPLFKIGFWIDEDYTVHSSYFTDLFRAVYAYYVAVIGCLMVVFRKRFVKKIYRCFIYTVVMAVGIVVVETIFIQTSFTCFTYVLPILVAAFMFHNISYDLETGTLDFKAFNAYIKDMKERKLTFIFVKMSGMSVEKNHNMSDDFIHFNESFFKNKIIFRLRDDKVILVFENEKNPDREKLIPAIIEEFSKLYSKYSMDYKIVIMETQDEHNTSEDYIGLDEYIESKMQFNSVYKCEKKDIDAYNKVEYIIEQLRDIHEKQDLNDDRVKVFCQPVFNSVSNTFSTAEALMRMELPECGLVFPDTFIPLAEKNSYIHTLSKIILNKTCVAIRNMLDLGYDIERISVNFSIYELKDKNFADDIVNIIKNNNIQMDKIAVELTESRNEKDFELVKSIMLKLHDLGIKFYLDDFGTGYSNFERILGLPIDIIKFDRSLTIMSARDEKSRILVAGFTNIFKECNYQILFEGVEDEDDEKRCNSMNAMYLQGYKYSKPIPIEQLNVFLSRKISSIG